MPFSTQVASLGYLCYNNKLLINFLLFYTSTGENTVGTAILAFLLWKLMHHLLQFAATIGITLNKNDPSSKEDGPLHHGKCFFILFAKENPFYRYTASTLHAYKVVARYHVAYQYLVLRLGGAQGTGINHLTAC